MSRKWSKPHDGEFEGICSDAADCRHGCCRADAAAQEASPLFIVHFETGPAWDKALEPSAQRGFAEHSANMNRRRKEGAISFGARYGDYGLIVLKSASMDAARAILDADPGVQSGIFIYRVAPLSVFYPWQE